jgi:hypothetical protein
MTNKLHIREIIAWTTLAIALILLSATIAFSQTKTINVENNDGKVHLKISKTENGKTTNIDTTFSVNDNDDIDKIISEFDGTDSGDKVIVRTSRSKNGSSTVHGKHKKIVVDVDGAEMSEKDKEKLHEDLSESMKNMKDGMKEMEESLKNMHIHIDENDSDGDFDFNFDMPDCRMGNNCVHAYSYGFSDDDDDAIDTLRDEDHIVIVTGKDENPPVLEKVIEGKDGKKVYIYKRSGAGKSDVDENEQAEDNVIRNLKYFPNPSSGKITVTFRTDVKTDISVRIIDSKSSEVFIEKLNDFKGEYSREINLSDKSKGNYMLKITYGDKTISKKIVVD